MFYVRCQPVIILENQWFVNTPEQDKKNKAKAKFKTKVKKEEFFDKWHLSRVV